MEKNITNPSTEDIRNPTTVLKFISQNGKWVQIKEQHTQTEEMEKTSTGVQVQSTAEEKQTETKLVLM